MDASAFEIDSGLTGLTSEESSVGVSDSSRKRIPGEVQVPHQRTVSDSIHGSESAMHSGGSMVPKNDRRFIARDWFNVSSERDCELMQIFIDQLNSANHVNYSKAYILFKERTGFPFSDPKHMRKRMDQIVYTFKTQGEMLPENVKRVIGEYNTALEAAKLRDSSNRKRLSQMEPVEIEDGNSSDDEETNGLLSVGSRIGIRASGSPYSGHGHSHVSSGVHHLQQAEIGRKRKYDSTLDDTHNTAVIKKLNDNVEKLTKMLEKHDTLLKRIVDYLDIMHVGENGSRDTSEKSNQHSGSTSNANAAVAAAAAAVSAASNVLNLNGSLSVPEMDPNHDPDVYNDAHINER